MCVFGKKTKILINSEIFLLCKNRKTQRRIKTVNERTGIRKKAKERSTNKLSKDCVLRKANAMQKSGGNKIQKRTTRRRRRDSVGVR